MHEQDFMHVEDHFNALVETLPQDVKNTYNKCRSLRIESAFRGRHFIVYKVRGKDPVELDRLTFLDFTCNDLLGARATLESAETGKHLTIGYTPCQVFDFPLFMFIPLHAKVRWATTPDSVGLGSLAFPLAVRTQSNRGMRELGVIHCETGVKYGQEFSFAINA